ncbi:glycosyltransferase family 2 protein [Gloeothece verrucosa]|uniref:Glycosyl transferase family 2 n=1 Tax=Gloeothece verrucosa (strain PCC 7822) TaxID=497965 RepID=E0U5S7_GLOV7|nr:glycosyltransferase family 2 protein [Gloeothece verrucosa]ADN15918.1 glycosyl transferase family 2 [Gloeothece verrucosa PCC 7822]
MLSEVKEHPSLLVVIVNYRTGKLTIDCLHSLVGEIQALPNTKVVVVDNNSGDQSVEQIETAINSQQWQDWVTLIPSDYNGGFAYGNNLAIRPALASADKPDYILLLNPDTQVRSDALKYLINFMNEHPHVGIAGSRLEDPDGTPQRSAFRFPTIWSELDSGLRLGIISKILGPKIIAPPVSDSTCQTDWIAGASMIIRREVFESIGLLDEQYFMYYEELDFCLQANRAGWSCWYVPESRVVHLVGQSSGVTLTKERPKRRPKYWFDSRKRFFVKNYGWLYAVLTDILWLTGFCLWKIRSFFQRKADNDPPYLLQDFLFNSVIFKFTN